MRKFYLLSVATYLLLVLLAFREPLVRGGVIGLKDDWIVAPLWQQVANLHSLPLYSWLEIFLGLSSLRATGDYLALLWGFLAMVFHLGGDFFSKAIPIIFIWFSGLTSLWMLKKLRIGNAAAFLGGFLYMFSPIIFNSLVSGYLILLLSYATIPLLFWILWKILWEKTGWREIILLGLILRVVFTQDNFIFLSLFMAVVMFGSAFLFEKGEARQWILKGIKITGGFVIAIFLTAQVFLMYSLSIKQLGGVIKATAFTWNTLVTSFLPKAFLLDGAGYQYFWGAAEGASKTTMIVGGYLILAISFFGLIFLRKNSLVKLTILLFLISIFIFKGGHPPLGNLIPLIFYSLPAVAIILRNMQYITFLSSLSLMILFALSVDYFFQKISNKRWRVVGLIILLAIVLLSRIQFFSGNFGGTIQTYRVSDDYKKVYEKLSKDKDDYRVLWVPSIQPLTYKGSRFAGNEPFLLGMTKNFLGNAPMHLIEETLFMNSYLVKTEGLDLLLKLLNVKKVIYRNDFQSAHLNFREPEFQIYRGIWKNENLKKTLEKISGLKLEEKIGEDIEIYDNQNFLPHIYAADNLYFYQGKTKDFPGIVAKKTISEAPAFIIQEPGNLPNYVVPMAQNTQEMLNMVAPYIKEGTVVGYAQEEICKQEKKDDKKMGDINEQDFLLYVSRSPISKKYILTQFKEGLEEFQLNFFGSSREEKFKRRKNILNKRLSEIKEFHLWETGFLTYETRLKEVSEFLRREFTEVEKGTLDVSTFRRHQRDVEVMIYGHERIFVNLLEEDEKHKILNSDQKEKLAVQVKTLFEDEKMSLYKMCGEKKQGNIEFKINVQRTGSYIVEWAVDEQNLEIDTQSIKKGDKVFLEKGEHKLVKNLESTAVTVKESVPERILKDFSGKLIIGENTNEPQIIFTFLGENSSFSLPNINFTKKDPTRYSVEAVGGKGPFILVFGENFNPGWEAIIKKDGGKEKIIGNHFVANAFANAWLVGADDYSGKANIIVRYRPQILYEKGLLVSMATLIICFLGLLVYRKK